MSLLPSSSQLRYAMAYILVTAVVLVILNIYTSTTMRQITFSAQKQALEEKAQLMTTALLQVADLSSPETEQAIESLDKDREFLTRGGVFSNEMLDAFIELKQAEITRLRMVPHPVEFDMYYSL